MKRNLTYILAFLLVGIIFSCQKMYRPPLGEIIKDPEPPAYNPLKSFFAFENNLTDQGENKLSASQSNTTYVPGITGQAIQIGLRGYVLLPVAGDTVKYPNKFIGIPKDTIENIGSVSFSFWMNGTTMPIAGGAQGLFSISHGSKFWGNFDCFLENYSDATDPSAAFFKFHLYNKDVEQWVDNSQFKIKNVLGRWTHVVVTYDGSTSSFALYKDAVLAGTVTLKSGSYGPLKFNNFNGIVLGSFQFQTNPSRTSAATAQDWALSFKGSLDQFRIYNKVLSASEVQQLFTGKQ
jgi:hypothetical protein